MLMVFYLKNRDAACDEYMSGFTKRLGGEWNLASKPFDPCRLKEVRVENLPPLHVLEIEPSFPPLFLFGILLFGLSLLFQWPWYITLLGGLMSFLCVFWIPEFYVLALRLGLKKAGSQVKVIRWPVDLFVREYVWGSETSLSG